MHLGPGLISPEPEACRNKINGRKEAAGQLLEARCDASEMLELVEVALDEVALAIDAPRNAALDQPTRVEGMCALAPLDRMSSSNASAS